MEGKPEIMPEDILREINERISEGTPDETPKGNSERILEDPGRNCQWNSRKKSLEKHLTEQSLINSWKKYRRNSEKVQWMNPGNRMTNSEELSIKKFWEEILKET